MNNSQINLYEKTMEAYNSIYDEISTKPLGRICHYTSKEAFISIISNCTLRFTYYEDFNDKTEGKIVFKFVLKLAKKKYPKSFYQSIRKRILNINHCIKARYFICCLSTDHDNKKMWKYYTKNKNKDGCNFEFEADELYHAICRNANANVSYSEVIYDYKVAKIKLVAVLDRFYVCWNLASNDYIKECVIDYLYDAIELFRFAFKKRKYEWENEERLILTLWDDSRTLKGINGKRYIDISFGGKNNYNFRGINISPYVSYESKEFYINKSIGYGDWCDIIN
ncbi:MAG: hypothetical protein ACI35S_02790 [Anaeroplasma sp.]